MKNLIIFSSLLLLTTASHPAGLAHYGYAGHHLAGHHAAYGHAHAASLVAAPSAPIYHSAPVVAPHAITLRDYARVSTAAAIVPGIPVAPRIVGTHVAAPLHAAPAYHAGHALPAPYHAAPLPAPHPHPLPAPLVGTPHAHAYAHHAPLVSPAFKTGDYARVSAAASISPGYSVASRILGTHVAAPLAYGHGHLAAPLTHGHLAAPAPLAYGHGHLAAPPAYGHLAASAPLAAPLDYGHRHAAPHPQPFAQYNVIRK